MVSCVPFPFSPFALFFRLPFWLAGVPVFFHRCYRLGFCAFFLSLFRRPFWSSLACPGLRFPWWRLGLVGARGAFRPAGWHAVFLARVGARWSAGAGGRARWFGGALVFGPGSVLALGGSRSLSSLPAGVLPALVASGAAFRVGCCVGFDALAVSFLQSAVPGRLSVFAAFGPGGAGACSLSAVAVVSSAARAGVPVSFWAGGGPAVPLVGRLAQRSAAVVRGSSALVLFSPGTGSMAGAGVPALRAGLPVFAFSPVAPGPVPGFSGRWSPVSLLGFSCWQWSPLQQSLF